jgi:2-phosphosulfolactate phosphatase
MVPDVRSRPTARGDERVIPPTLGSRGEFFIACHRDRPDPRIRGAAVVAIDVIRASTTAITAVAAGRRCLLAASPAVARRIATRTGNALLAGEVGGEMPPGFDLQNSPTEILALADADRPVVLVSTSGVPLMIAAVPLAPVYVASLRNARATASGLAGVHRRIAILGADRRGRLRREDALCAARIAGDLANRGYAAADAVTQHVLRRWGKAPDDALLGGRSDAYLRSSGQVRDLEFVLAHIDDLGDAYVVTPELEVAVSG